MKVKLLAVAVALAASANVSAAILSPIEANGQSEAVFSIWNTATNQSYSQDLGTTWQTFRDNLGNSAFNVSYAVDAGVFTAALGGSDSADWVWNVSVASAKMNDNSNIFDWGVISTSNLGNNINSAALGQAVSSHDQYATSLKGVVNNSDPALNDAYFGTVANGGYAGDEAIWGTSWKTNGSTNNSAAFGTDLDFYYWMTGGFNPSPSVTQAAGSWSFDGTNLAYGSAVSAVPVPAAAWLMGSGLLGLVGVARRKQQS